MRFNRVVVIIVRRRKTATLGIVSSLCIRRFVRFWSWRSIVVVKCTSQAKERQETENIQEEYVVDYRGEGREENDLEYE